MVSIIIDEGASCQNYGNDITGYKGRLEGIIVNISLFKQHIVWFVYWSW